MKSLRFPRAMPHWCYLDPALIGETRLLSGPVVPCETSTPVQTSAPRDRFYTQARRLHIQSLMKGRT